MMSLHAAPLFSFDFFPPKPVEIEISPNPLTSDAGLLPVRQCDQNLRLTEQFAAALDDRRDPTLTRQSLLSMVRQRVYGILADYEDQNDHDTLRSDPVFKLVADRAPDGPDLASRPSRGSRTPCRSPTCGGCATCSWICSFNPSRSRPGTSRSTSTRSTTPRTGSSN